MMDYLEDGFILRKENKLLISWEVNQKKMEVSVRQVWKKELWKQLLKGEVWRWHFLILGSFVNEGKVVLKCSESELL